MNTLIEEENKPFSCALTGHRILEKNFDGTPFKEAVNKLIEENGVHTFYCGMAIGFDLYACEYLQNLRSTYPQIKVIACIPCPEQADKFTLADKRKYERLLGGCDRREIISPHYTNACMFLRNRYMVDRSGFLLAHCLRDTGGSAYTVQYARTHGIKIYEI